MHALPQIFAQLIELSPQPINAVYMGLFAGLLSPLFWERSGNVPALTRLLTAYLTKAGDQVRVVLQPRQGANH